VRTASLAGEIGCVALLSAAQAMTMPLNLKDQIFPGSICRAAEAPAGLLRQQNMHDLKFNKRARLLKSILHRYTESLEHAVLLGD